MIDRFARNKRESTDNNLSGDSREERWRAIDVAAMVFAALRIVVPYLFVILAITAAVFGLFMLVFG